MKSLFTRFCSLCVCVCFFLSLPIAMVCQVSHDYQIGILFIEIAISIAAPKLFQNWYCKIVCFPRAQHINFDTVLIRPGKSREGVNREKLTVKKIINEEMFFCFFTVYVPYKLWKALRKPWKNRHLKSTIFSPLVFHRLCPHENHPKMPIWDPQNEFPGIPWIGLFLGISILFSRTPWISRNFPAFPG